LASEVKSGKIPIIMAARKKKADTGEARVLETAETLLNLLGIKGKVEVAEDKENEALAVNIETEEAGILIGRHGETISAFQVVLGQILQRQTGEWQRVLVDTGDYRTKQQEMLKSMAEQAAERVKQTGNPYTIYDLTSSQRRFVHMILSEDPQIITESEGEGRERHLVVKPR